ncbi:MAG: tRNA lysidine(34) synthetase TilS, partial [Pseudomonadota bacterium]
ILSCRVSSGTSLSVTALRRLSPPRRRNLIRYWLRAQGLQAPSAMHLDQIMVLTENEPRSRHGLMRWPGTDVHRFRDELMAFPARAPLDNALCLLWDPSMSLEIPGSGLRLRSEPVIGAGLSRARIGHARLTVRLRQGGEICQLAGRRHHHKLKKLLQEAGIPPWERGRLPLVYADDDLAAIGDRWVCEPYAARTDELSWKLVLESAREFNRST